MRRYFPALTCIGQVGYSNRGHTRDENANNASHLMVLYCEAFNLIPKRSRRKEDYESFTQAVRAGERARDDAIAGIRHDHDHDHYLLSDAQLTSFCGSVQGAPCCVVRTVYCASKALCHCDLVIVVLLSEDRFKRSLIIAN
ncbi:unnamed protein product, partial [Brenthis ino]